MLLSALAGCSGSGSPSGARHPTARPADVQPVIDVRVPPGTAKGFVGALEDVHDLTCTSGPRAWTVRGSVTNPTRKAASYRIYTSFLDSRRDTRGLVEVDVRHVAAHKTARWHGQITSTARDLGCVLRVERTAG
jgi:hypothetical protein